MSENHINIALDRNTQEMRPRLPLGKSILENFADYEIPPFLWMQIQSWKRFLKETL